MSDSYKSSKMPYKTLVDYRITPESLISLENLGCEVFFTKKHPKLNRAICGHADMLACRIGDYTVAEPDFYNQIKSIANNKILCGKTRLNELYPYDIAYNAAHVGKYLIHNLKYTDPVIMELAEDVISVKQGYTKCSICKVNDEAIITSDEGIAKAVAGKIDVLRIRKGFINLDSMNYGFIGGCSGLIKDNLLVFNGCIENHPDYHNIHDFCRSHHVDIFSLNNDTLYDIGSIIII